MNEITKGMIGKEVIVRATQAGVFFGTLKEQDGDTVKLENARKLWYWQGAAAVEQIALEGVKHPDQCKFTVFVDELVIFGVNQVIPCSEKSANQLKEIDIWKR